MVRNGFRPSVGNPCKEFFFPFAGTVQNRHERNRNDNPWLLRQVSLGIPFEGWLFMAGLYEFCYTKLPVAFQYVSKQLCHVPTKNEQGQQMQDKGTENSDHANIPRITSLSKGLSWQLAINNSPIRLPLTPNTRTCLGV